MQQLVLADLSFFSMGEGAATDTSLISNNFSTSNPSVPKQFLRKVLLEEKAMIWKLVQGTFGMWGWGLVGGIEVWRIPFAQQ